MMNGNPYPYAYGGRGGMPPAVYGNSSWSSSSSSQQQDQHSRAELDKEWEQLKLAQGQLELDRKFQELIKAEKHNLKIKVKNLKAQLAQANQELEEYKNQKEHPLRQLPPTTIYEDDVIPQRQHEEEVSKMQEKLNDTQLSLASLFMERDKLQRERDELFEQNRQQKQENKELLLLSSSVRTIGQEEKTAKECSKCQNVQRQAKELEESLDAMKKVYSTTLASHAREKQEWNDQVAALENSNSYNVQRQAKELEESLDAMKKVYATALASHAREKQEWKDQMAALENSNSQSNSAKNDAMNKEIVQRLEAENQSLKVQLESLVRENASLQRMTSRVATSSSSSHQHQEEVKRLEGLIATQRQQLEDLKLLLPRNKLLAQEAEEKCSKLEMKCAQWKEQYAQQATRIQELETQQQKDAILIQQQEQELKTYQADPNSGRVIEAAYTLPPVIIPADGVKPPSKDGQQYEHVIEKEWSNATTKLRGMYTGWVDLDGQPHGHGTLRIEDGSIYDGEWTHGFRDGHGVYTHIDGDLYRGTWEDDKFHGRGVYVWYDGQMYTGDYVDGRRNGVGIETWLNGARYEGEYRRDLRHGEGKYYYPDGRTYVGEYRDDKPHGQGKQIAKDGKILFDGEWCKGEFVNDAADMESVFVN